MDPNQLLGLRIAGQDKFNTEIEKAEQRLIDGKRHEQNIALQYENINIAREANDIAHKANNLSEESNRISYEANNIAKDANRKSRRANIIAIISAAFTLGSLIASIVIALCK